MNTPKPTNQTPTTYLLKAPSGTKFVNASELRKGDIILRDDGSFYSVVEEIYDDIDGLWLDDGYNMGYTDPYAQYLIEWGEE